MILEHPKTMRHAPKSPTKKPYSRHQGVYWILTIPHEHFTPYLPTNAAYCKGQLELGDGETNYLHWQLIVIFKKKISLRTVRSIFGNFHAELTKSEAAEDYVWKEETRVQGTQFELGTRPFRRNVAKDWDEVWAATKAGRIDDVPADIRIRCYNTLRKIESDYAEPIAQERTCKVFWGETETGKSRRAWEEAGITAYPKDPRTKFWCGYRGQGNVVIDEFRGDIDVGHLLRWLDRYPTIVENKGSSKCLNATKYWITSNLHPDLWYPQLDEATRAALKRRLQITQFHKAL